MAIGLSAASFFCSLGGLPAALAARRPWAGPSGLRVAGGQAGLHARTGGRMRGREYATEGHPGCWVPW